MLEVNEILRQPSYAMSMIRKGKRSARGKSGRGDDRGDWKRVVPFTRRCSFSFRDIILDSVPFFLFFLFFAQLTCLAFPEARAGPDESVFEKRETRTKPRTPSFGLI